MRRRSRSDAPPSASSRPATPWTSADATSVARETGRVPSIAALADAIRRGYETRMGIRFVAPGALPPSAPDPGWAGERVSRPDLGRHASMVAQLGTIAVDCARDGDRLRDVVVSGDFLADSPAVARLEMELRGCAVDVGAVRAVIDRAFAPPEHFLLGVAPHALAELICRAAA